MAVEAAGLGPTGIRNTASNISGVLQNNQSAVAEPGEWTLRNTPASNTQATATKAAGGVGVRHVLRSITAGLNTSVAAAVAQNVYIRDGSSGVGAILYEFFIGFAAVAGNTDRVVLSGLNIVGSANTAMTVEFSGAAGANSFESVLASGYSTI